MELIRGTRLLASIVLFGVTDQAQAQKKAVDACTLLTRAEAEEILGTKLGHPEPRGNGCWFGNDFAVYFALMSPESPAEFEAAVKKDIDKLNERMRKTGAKETVIEPVKGLGVPALYAEPTLLLWRDRRVLTILADRPQAEKIAAKLLPRWK